MIGNFVTYRSSAGSGKTYTLVKEYLKLALHNSSPSYYKRVLAITFTNKAAEEMKERILNQLTIFSKAKNKGAYLPKLLAKKEHDLLITLVTEINERYSFAKVTEKMLLERADKTLSHILHHYSDLSISTIDSFVHGIVRSFARDMELDTEFEVTLDQKKILKNTIKTLLGEVGNQQDLTPLVMQFIHTKIDDAKSWSIQNDLEKFGEIIFKDSAQEELKKLQDISASQYKAIRKKLYAEIKKFEKKIENIAENALNMIAQSGLETTDFSSSTIPLFFIRLKDNPEKKLNISKTLAKMIAEESNWLPVKNKGKKPLLVPIKDKIKDYYFELVDLLENDEMNAYLRRKLILKNFHSNTLLNYINAYTEAWKLENNTVLISDFNKMISRIVVNNPAPFIFEKIGEHYLHILIDEFQDTALLQWQNFLPLIDNSLSKGKFNMVVGDAKQAIYRWRDGEVMQFVKLPEVYRPMNKHLASIGNVLKQNHLNEELDTNYRSSKEVIEFNNQLYKHLAAHLGNYQNIYDNVSQKVGKNNRGWVTLEGYTGKEKIEKTDNQFTFILDKIIAALDDGYQQKDIAVIVRTNDEGKDIAEKILDNTLVQKLASPTNKATKNCIAKGLSVITSESLLLKNNIRVKTLIALAKITANPNDDAAKVTVITNLSNLELLIDPLHQILQRYKKTEKSTNGKRKKTSLDFSLFMQQYFPNYHSEKLKTKGIYEIMESFVQMFHFETSSDNYLEFFMHSVMRDPTLSLHSFLTWWEDYGTKLSVGESAGSDGIRIMTIHKSKGLQFPVVIFPIKNAKEKASTIWLGEDAAVGMPTALVKILAIEKNIAISPEIEEEKNKLFLDLINGLYVATTRSEDRLHLLVEQPEKPNFDELKHTYQYLENAIREMPYSSNEYGELEIGKRRKRAEIIAEPDGNQQWMESFISQPIEHGVQISFKKTRLENEHSTLSEKDYGILIHDILATIKTREEIGSIVDEKLKEGLLSDKNKGKILEELEEIMATPAMKKWYDSKVYLIEKSEKELLTDAGKVIRPDKVVFFEDGVEVVDFKTGEPHESHHNQVREYLFQIQKTTDKPVKGFLVYTKSKKIVPVASTIQGSLF